MNSKLLTITRKELDKTKNVPSELHNHPYFTTKRLKTKLGLKPVSRSKKENNGN